MRKIKIIDLFGVEYAKMNEKVNTALEDLQREGKEIVDFKVLGDSLNKSAVFVMYEEK
jgi:hypothetical protein